MWRSRKVAWLAVLLALALVVAACAGDDSGSEETTAATEAPDATLAPATTAAPTTTAAPDATSTTVPTGPAIPYGGEVTVADDEEPPTLNPFVPGGDSFIVSIIGQSYLAGVYEIDGYSLELVPELVTELPTIANGGVVLNADGTMTVRYTILEEAVWSDGTPISGDDFQFTLETIMNPENKIASATYEDIIETEVGPKTFTYTLSAPSTLYELLFKTVLPKHAVEGTNFATDWNDEMWPSAGPFVFEEWETGEYLRVVRNENYWKSDPETGQQLPYLDAVTFRFIPDTASIINAFEERAVEVIQPPIAPQTIEGLKTLEPEGAVVEVLSGPVWEHLSFQFGPGRLERNQSSVNENLNYRKCVAHAIDKQLIVDSILAGQVDPMDSYVEAFTPGLSQGAWAQYPYDVDMAIEFCDAARAELDVDTLTAVFTSELNNEARVKLSELLAPMFSAVGIEYENQLVESQLFLGETLHNGLFDVGEWAWAGSPGLSGLVSIHDVWDPEDPPPAGGSNYYRWGSEDSVVIDENTTRYAELRDAMNATVDRGELIALFNEAENILADQVVIIPLYSRLVYAAVWGDEVGGFKHNPTQASHTWNIEEWYRVDQ